MRAHSTNCLLYVLILRAGFAPTASAEPLPSPPAPVRVRTVQGLLDANLISFSFKDGLRVEVNDDVQLIPTPDIVSITHLARLDNADSTSGAMGPGGPDGVVLELVGGDRVAGRLADASPDAVAIEAQYWGRLVISLEGIASIRFSSAESSSYSQSSDWFQRESNSPEDRILLTNGDVVAGFVAAIDRNGIRIESGGDINTIPLRLAVAARFVNSAPGTRSELHAVLGFGNALRMTVSELEWLSGKLKVKAASGESAELAAESVRSVEVRGGRWIWLSQLKPSELHQPMLTLEWKHTVNRNVLGNPLRVAGRRFDQGIGVHSRSVLTYELPGLVEEFVTSFGMDDDSGRLADVQVTVSVDGKSRFEESNVISGKLHGPVRVDVTGAKRLDLVVDFGQNGDIQDRFDWIEPGLVRTAPP